MSFLYPRLVSIRRLNTEAVQNGVQQVGLLGYSGAEQTEAEFDPTNGEQILFKNICCSIQARQSGRTKGTMLPTDIISKPEWLIIIPASQLPIYSIRDRDIIADDEGYRYQVAQNWFAGLSYNLSCIRLEA
jgi:hypothetical protein